MVSIESVRKIISTHFQHVQDLGSGILRAELIHKDKPYVVAYVDLSDEIVDRSKVLTEFQEKLLGAEFFSPDTDLRWNSYLYFLAGPKSMANKQFRVAKARIEGDRHFARKFVLDADDFIQRFRDFPKTENIESEQVIDAGATWADVLNEANLSSLLKQPARKLALEHIINGEAFTAALAQPASKSTRKADPLAKGLLRNLKIGSFRPVIQGKSFSFSDVNLIVGANGTGKTSLLEAIEVLYCGRVRRDPEAYFSDIVGILDNGQDKLESVRAPTAVSVLKERNIYWYGRADFQSNAISQGFSRFNFLDTDAAFRLSSDVNYEDIKEDLAKLLVGPETSKFWDYLSKLCDDVKTRLRMVSGRMVSQRQTVGLLEEEVARLRDTPSRASALMATYRDGLARLAPEWLSLTDNNSLAATERERLDELTRATKLILSAVPETPVTRATIERRIAQLNDARVAVKAIHQKYEENLARSVEAQSRLGSLEAQQAELEEWLRILKAGVPGLASSIREAEGRISTLLSLLSDQPDGAPPPVPAEYVAVGVSAALEQAREKLASVQDLEMAAKRALSESIQVGQSLQAIRQDLHDVALAYIERSGELSSCPICKTEHSPPTLVAKLEALVLSHGASATESLRRNAQFAREQTVRCEQNFTLLVSLEKFARMSGASESTACEELHAAFHKTVMDLSAATADVKKHRDELTLLESHGINWSGWERTRDSRIAPMLPPGTNPESYEAISTVLGALRDQADNESAAIQREDEQAAALVQQLAERVASEIDDQLPKMGPAQQVTTLERSLRHVETALLELDGLAGALQLPPGANIEQLQVQVEACLLAFDQAQHAMRSEDEARVTSEQKLRDLRIAIDSLAEDTTRHHNLLRADKALSKIVEQHSLEHATADAFGAIRSKVSAVFAQIHSPQEYEIGDFTNESIIVRRDNKQSHAINQVSTGQRAALALSIFLALNSSAESAPPVILIDDPVAHIDDLNTLSFLDYLREVALRCRKQIFFATADVRLAALFQRKFEFLGSGRFKRISLPLPDDPS